MPRRPSQSPKEHRQGIVAEQEPQRAARPPEASGEASNDDGETVAAETSIITIMESIRARSEAAGQSSGDAAGCDPFARSSFKTAVKSVGYGRVNGRKSGHSTVLLHNGHGAPELRSQDRWANRPASYSTDRLHSRPRGIVRQGTIFHYRRRIPVDLRAAYGKCEVWRSLATTSVRTAARRVHAVA
jgi:hypothetical protein